MPWLRRLIVMLALIEGTWLAFDGCHALVTGDYVTPSGRYAGQLGPWSHVVSAVGIEPRSTLMKSIHLGLGAALIVAGISFAQRRLWGWWGTLLCAILGLWYLPLGTIVSVALIVLLFRRDVRTAGNEESRATEPDV